MAKAEKHTLKLEIEKPQYITVNDVTYAQVDSWFGHCRRDLKLDIIYPEAQDGRTYPCILWICGGAWLMMDKSAHNLYLSRLASGGFVVASVEYRTSNQGPYPMPLQDVKAAIRYLKAHADRFRINKEQMGVMGESAGGYLTCMAALDHDPALDVGEYLEESPLGKAEWLVAISELTDNRTDGIKVFQAIPERYNKLKQLTANAIERPTVMLNTPWNDSWSMPSVKSYAAQLISDAGGEYIYKKNTSHGAEPIGLETAYGLIREADIWLNVGMATTMDELKNMNPKFKDAKAIRQKKVYNNNLRLNPGGGNDYWESGSVHPDIVLRDLIKILHPKLISEELYYYRHLE